MVYRVPDDGSLTYHSHFEAGQPIQSSVDAPEEAGKARVAVHATLLHPDSVIECRRVRETGERAL